MDGPQSGKAIAMVSSPKQSPSALRQSPLTYPKLRPLGSARGVQEGGIYPQDLEEGLRSERALMLASVQGVSTCRVAVITEKFWFSMISSAQVSRAAALLDEGTRAGTVVGTLAKPSRGHSYLFVPGSLVRKGAGKEQG